MGLENNKKYYEVLNSKVNLTSKPVAIKLINSKEDVPEGISLLNDKIRHCEMVKNASLGEKFYTTIDQHLCLGGAGGQCIALSRLLRRVRLSSLHSWGR